MTIPSHHNVGDEGHTDDHNAIADVLTGHEDRVAALETARPSFMVKTGNNIITLTNPSGTADQVIVPTGPRDNAALIRTVTVANKRVWWLDAYGQQRLEAASVDATPLVVSGYDNNQAGDLQIWQKHGTGAVLSWVDRNGSIYAPNLTPSDWTNLTLAPGIAWNPQLGTRPQYRTVGDKVELRGNVQKSNGSDFTVSPTDIGTVPPALIPPAYVYSVQGASFRAGYGYVRMEIVTSGLIRALFQASTYAPAWISLDNISYSLTP